MKLKETSEEGTIVARTDSTASTVSTDKPTSPDIANRQWNKQSVSSRSSTSHLVGTRNETPLHSTVDKDTIQTTGPPQTSFQKIARTAER